MIIKSKISEIFKRKNRDKQIIPEKCTITFFGGNYPISVIIEGDVSDDDCIDYYNRFINMHGQIELTIKEYVEKNYFELIKEYYTDITFSNTTSGKNYEAYSAIRKDYENNKRNATDIFLKNIRPIYYSILENGRSILFILFNDADGHGMDLVITPELKVISHDE